MIWIQIVISAVSAVVGGLVGSWSVAFRFGQRLQRIDDRLEAAEGRLERGNRPLDLVPVLDVRLQALIDDVHEIKQELRDWLPRLVSKEECDRRHGDGR